MEGKQNTASVIASLMGLDELPPQQSSHRQQKVLSDDYLRKTASIGMLKKSSLHVGHGRQKNSCAKRFLSIDEKLYHAKEPNDVLEDVHVARDNLRHFNLSNLSTKQLHDCKVPQLHLRSGLATAPTIISAPNYGESAQLKQSDKLLTESTVSRSIQKLKNDCGESDIDCELLKTHSGLKDKTSNFSTRIVLLKPNSRKPQNYATNLLLLRSNMPSQSSDSGYTGYGELFNSDSREVNINVIKTENTTSNMEPSRHGFKDHRHVEKKAAQEEKKSNGSSHRATPRSRVIVEDSSQNLLEASSQDSFYWEKREQISNPFPHGSVFAREAKKQIFERWKTTKSFEEVGVSGRLCTLGQMFAIHDREAMPKSMYSKVEKNCLSSALCPQKENSDKGTSVLSSKVGSINEYIRKLPRPKLQKSSSIDTKICSLKLTGEAFQNWSSGQKEVVPDNHHKLNGKNIFIEDSLESRNSGDSREKQHYFFGEDLEGGEDLHLGLDHNLPNWGVQNELEKDMHKEADDQSSSDVWDDMTQQKSSYDSPSRDLIPRCPTNDSELGVNLREINQPSPDSVLEPPFKEENLCASEFFDSPVSDLSGLAMKLQLLNPNSEETNSEGSGMAVSSDEDSEKGSVDLSQDNEKLRGPLRTEESRNFSYLIDVLDEANLCGMVPDMWCETWRGKESPVSFSVFEALEKKYGKQMSWQKSERRLLFDRINSGLREILSSSMDFRMSEKPLRRRLKATLRRDEIEEELWMILISQEREVSKDLSEKVLGREMRWLELEDDISIICRELVDFLFDELATEMCSSGSI